MDKVFECKFNLCVLVLVIDNLEIKPRLVIKDEDFDLSLNKSLNKSSEEEQKEEKEEYEVLKNE